MFKIILPQLNKTISTTSKDSLMKVLLDNEVPVASSCLGDGVCSKCVLNIKAKKLTTRNNLETRLSIKYKWSKEQRASCQIKINTDLTVTSTYW